MRLARSYEELRGRDIEGFVRFIGEQEALGAAQLEAVSEEEGADAVRLLTIHAAKGLEFKVVVVADAGRDRAPIADILCLSDGRFGFKVAHPMTGSRVGTTSYSDVKEAREQAERAERLRLYYVAMTRAMERLTLSYARERRRYGQHSFGSPSRFLREIPTKLLDFRGGAGFSQAPEHGSAPRPRSEGRHYDYSYDQGGADDAASDAGVRKGTRLRHPIFGAGVVLEVIGRGPAQKLRIQFDRAGVKTVLVRYANLELG
jgi:DNA helicase-2/ATP-dependent DNA helicase PcrA